MSGIKILDQVEIDLRNTITGNIKTIYLNIYENSLSKKWLAALNQLLHDNYHLEKNYCFFGFAKSPRNGSVILNQVNKSIQAINDSNLGYTIDDNFTMENTLKTGPIGECLPGRMINRDKLNNLHRYFEDLQGTSGAMSPFFQKADPRIRWHIRQLNLLCHEFESWAMSYRKEVEAPEWQRPSQLMCWLNAPRFLLTEEDYELFGIETINRSLGGVSVGVNKAVGKHHWEVFTDEGRDSRISELTTSTLRTQTEAAGDFDIEWANNPGKYQWHQKKLSEFREWLISNGFDPENKALTIGYPQIGEADLGRSFQTNNYKEIWNQLNSYLDVYAVRTSSESSVYDYQWSDNDFIDRQIDIISKGYHHEVA